MSKLNSPMNTANKITLIEAALAGNASYLAEVVQPMIAGYERTVAANPLSDRGYKLLNDWLERAAKVERHNAKLRKRLAELQGENHERP